MTESLSKKRDEMRENLLLPYATNDEISAFNKGFDAAVTLLEPEIDELETALAQATVTIVQREDDVNKRAKAKLDKAAEIDLLNEDIQMLTDILYGSKEIE